ncbi:DNA repair protein XRCC2-like [Hondaea fermentalgiana]|uniref:DNA repair protein XRCC2-like n=1 Tax=Hondaea fermentalgiana TaxID=2315210 RepID=A0A2R5GDU2_9STRA|nr:DNA repair protein XRCC2-like [Hondaea fermentalgiana]|eukprot:GBG27888.1 DNA repair protein XRCC2-like [Hondaea fermentalgiana]
MRAGVAGGVAEETAFELLRRTRGGAGPGSGARGCGLFARTGLPALDALRETQRVKRRAAAAAEAAAKKTPAAAADVLCDVVEISGATQTGKTELVLRAVATCVLPAELELELDAHDGDGESKAAPRTLHLGGEGASVVFFDSDLRLNVVRLAAIIAAPLEKALVVFDSIAAHYWQDTETDSVSAGFHVSIPLAIQQLARRHMVAILCVKPMLFQPRGADRAPEYLSQTWQKLVTLRLFAECLDGHSRFRLSHLGQGEERVFDFSIDHAGVKVASS